MDVKKLEYDDEYFDLIIDKSTLDTLLCGYESFINSAIMLKEIQRVLKTEGLYVIISYGKPETRLFHLNRDFLSFDIEIIEINKKLEENVFNIKEHSMNDKVSLIKNIKI